MPLIKHTSHHTYTHLHIYTSHLEKPHETGGPLLLNLLKSAFIASLPSPFLLTPETALANSTLLLTNASIRLGTHTLLPNTSTPVSSAKLPA